MHPNQYWSRLPEHSSQRLYIAFCEFAASVLDYCEGAETFRCASRSGAVRLNWAATALYYSLVHSGRFLVFVCCGDFPTGHAMLHRCFQRDTRTRTDWLNRFVRYLTERDAAANADWCTEVEVADLCSFWTRTFHKDTTVFFRWFGQVLGLARQLRNDDNYECLLIAHEYEHPQVTEMFRRMANALHAVAGMTLKNTAALFAAYASSEPSKAAFIRAYVDSRIVQPCRAWYGAGPNRRMQDFLQPLLELQPIEQCIAEAEVLECRRAIEHHIGVPILTPELGLMSAFGRDACDLEDLCWCPASDWDLRS